jgi:alpha-ketoglutarate-dependent taurine dioxygenase
MWFLCARPAERGGQTIVCDGVAVVPALSASTRRLFESKRLKYIRHYTEEQWKLLYQTNDLGEVRQFCEQNDLRLQVNKDRSVQTEFLAPAIRETKWSGSRSFCNSLQIGIWQEKLLGRRVNFVRLEDDSEIPEEVLAEIDEITESLSENIPWSSGDFAIVDNTRMLHGRRAFDDPTREIYVRMCRSVSW